MHKPSVAENLGMQHSMHCSRGGGGGGMQAELSVLRRVRAGKRAARWPLTGSTLRSSGGRNSRVSSSLPPAVPNSGFTAWWSHKGGSGTSFHATVNASSSVCTAPRSAPFG